MSECGQPIYLVIIPRAQHEALMAAAKIVADRDSDPKEWMRKRYEVLAALRAAGIPEGEPND